MKKKLTFIGLVTGFVNGLLGGAAGLICVPLIKAAMQEENKAHAYTVATVLAASFVSAITYLLAGNLNFNRAAIYNRRRHCRADRGEAFAEDQLDHSQQAVRPVSIVLFDKDVDTCLKA